MYQKYDILIFSNPTIPTGCNGERRCPTMVSLNPFVANLSPNRGKYLMTTVTHTSLISQVAEGVSRTWWLILLRGIAVILVGIYAFLQPGMTLLFFTTLLGAYALIDGVLAFISGIAGWSESRWWSILAGLLGIVAGALVLANPGLATGLSVLILLFVVAFRSIFSGIFEIVAAIRLRKEIQGEWMLILLGILSVIFGAIVLMNPLLALATLLPVVAAFAVIYGVIMIFIAFRVKNLPNRFA